MQAPPRAAFPWRQSATKSNQNASKAHPVRAHVAGKLSVSVTRAFGFPEGSGAVTVSCAPNKQRTPTMFLVGRDACADPRMTVDRRSRDSLRETAQSGLGVLEAEQIPIGMGDCAVPAAGAAFRA